MGRSLPRMGREEQGVSGGLRRRGGLEKSSGGTPQGKGEDKGLRDVPSAISKGESEGRVGAWILRTALLFIFAVALSLMVFLLRREVGLWTSLADALLFSGAIFLSAAALGWVWSLGALDSTLYSLRSVVRVLIPFFGARDREIYSRHTEGRVRSGALGSLLAVGIAMTLPAVIISVALW